MHIHQCSLYIALLQKQSINKFFILQIPKQGLFDWINQNLLNQKKINIFTNFQFFNNEIDFEIKYNNKLLLDQLKNKVLDISTQINFINLNNYKDLKIQLNSKSQLINYQQIKIKLLKNLPYIYENLNQIKLLNVYNYILQKFELNNTIKYKEKKSNQSIRIDIDSDRVYNFGWLNFINKKIPKIVNKIQCDKNNLLINVDIHASVISLFCLMFEIKVQGNIYEYLYNQIKQKYAGENIEFDSAQQLKQKIFKIIFSNKLNKYTKVQIFKKMYLFTKYLKQQYDKNRYIKSLIINKKICKQKNLSTGQLLAKYLFNLQGQIYIYLIGLFMFCGLNPVIFQYDSILFNVDINNFLFFQKNIVIIDKIGLNYKVEKIN